MVFQDQPEHHAIEFQPKRTNGDVAELEVGQLSEPFVQPPICGVYRLPMPVIGSGTFDTRVKVVTFRAEAVKNGIPPLMG